MTAPHSAEMGHRRSDPSCERFRAPRNAVGRWWFDRQLGKSCRVCCAKGWALALSDASTPPGVPS